MSEGQSMAHLYNKKENGFLNLDRNCSCVPSPTQLSNDFKHIRVVFATLTDLKVGVSVVLEDTVSVNNVL
jgi:hypothetical protein